MTLFRARVSVVRSGLNILLSKYHYIIRGDFLSDFRISTDLNVHISPRNDIFEYIRQGLLALKSLGFDAANFSCGFLTFFGQNIPDSIEKVKSISEEVGICFELAHLPFGINPNASAESFSVFNQQVHDAIDAMALLGVSYATVHPNTITERTTYFNRKAQYDSVMKHLSPFVEHANRVGLNITVENMRLVHESFSVHRYCGDPEELCEIADALGIGICWDTGHGHINGIRQSEALEYIGSRLKMLHLNDNHGSDDIHLAPFMGTIDWADVMNGLKAIHYNGLLNFELNASGRTSETRRAFGEYVYAAAKELMQIK